MTDDADPVSATDETAVGEMLGGPGLDAPEALASQAAREVARSKLFGRPRLAPTVGRYRILEPLGAGAMGEVFAAEDPELSRKVAIKVLHPRVAGDASNRARLRQEAQSLARLAHEYVATIYEYGEADERPYVAMELVDGATMRSWMETERALDEILLVFRQAAWGLHAAHEAGLVHRDFKPDNVMVSEGLGDDPWRVRVMDFGLATAKASLRPPREPELDISRDMAAEATQSVTASDRFAGTPAYMAPEQYRGEAADARSDQWAFCVSLFEALYGKRPFEADTVLSLCRAILDGDRSEVSREGVPAWVRQAIDRGLSTRPDDRHPSMADLARLLDPVPRRRRARTLQTIGGSLLLGLGGGVVLWAQADDDGPDCKAGSPADGLWTEDTRGRVRAGFDQTGLAYAEQTWTRLDAQLEAYAQSWRESYLDACQATHLRHEQSTDLLDLRNACLDSRLDAAQVLVEQLQPVDADVVERAPRAVLSLPPIADCDDRSALLDSGRTALERARARPFERSLAAVVARRELGHYQAALEAAERLEGELEDADLPWLQASLLYEVAMVHARTGDADATSKAARGAYRVAIRSGEDEVATLAASLLAQVDGYLRGQLDRGREWAEDSQAFLDRLGDDPRRTSALLNARGVLTELSGDLDAAERLHQEAVALRRDHFGPDHYLVSDSLNNLAAVSMARGDTETAERLLREAIEVSRRGLGEDHPEQLGAWLNLGSVMFQAGNLEGAETEFRGALRLAETIGAGQSQEATLLRNNLADLLVRKGRFEGAVAAFERAFEAKEALGQLGRADHASSMSNYAVALAFSGQTERAMKVAAEALELESTRQGETSRSRPLVETNYAVVANQAGEFGLSRELHEAALRSKEGVYGTDSPKLLSNLLALAELARDHGDPADAQPHLDRAARLVEDASVLPDVRGRFHRLRAQFHAAGGHTDDAAQEAKTAVSILRGAGMTDTDDYRQAAALSAAD